MLEKDGNKNLAYLRALATKGNKQLLCGEGNVYSRAMMDSLMEKAIRDHKEGKSAKKEVRE